MSLPTLMLWVRFTLDVAGCRHSAAMYGMSGNGQKRLHAYADAAVLEPNLKSIE